MRVLNIGCGNRFDVGTDFVDLAPQDPRVLKVDVSIEQLPYNDATFDVVYVRNVLTIIPDLDHVLGECFRVLKQSGRLLLIVSNATGIDSVLGDNKGFYNKVLDKQQPSYHAFTKQTLCAWLVRNGFGDLDLRYITDIPTVKTARMVLVAVAVDLLGHIMPKFHSQIYCTAYKV